MAHSDDSWVRWNTHHSTQVDVELFGCVGQLTCSQVSEGKLTFEAVPLLLQADAASIPESQL